jgi:hypothetical protein
MLVAFFSSPGAQELSADLTATKLLTAFVLQDPHCIRLDLALKNESRRNVSTMAGWRK